LIYAVQGDWENAKKEYMAALALAQPSDTRAAIQDIQDALKKKPHVAALKEALKMLALSQGGK